MAAGVPAGGPAGGRGGRGLERHATRRFAQPLSVDRHVFGEKVLHISVHLGMNRGCRMVRARGQSAIRKWMPSPVRRERRRANYHTTRSRSAGAREKTKLSRGLPSDAGRALRRRPSSKKPDRSATRRLASFATSQ